MRNLQDIEDTGVAWCTEEEFKGLINIVKMALNVERYLYRHGEHGIEQVREVIKEAFVPFSK